MVVIVLFVVVLIVQPSSAPVQVKSPKDSAVSSVSSMEEPKTGKVVVPKKSADNKAPTGEFVIQFKLGLVVKQRITYFD